MADINKTIEIDVVVESQNLDKAAQGIEKITKSTDSHTKSLEQNKKGVLENGGAMGLLGAATGGLAMDFKDAIEAIELTGVSLKGLRGALIATGIGALAIILLELITNWDKWSGVIDGSANSLLGALGATQRLTNELEILTKQQEMLNAAQETGISLAEAWGLSEDEIYQQKKKNNEDLIKENDKQIAKLKQLMIVEQNRWSTDWEKYKEYRDKITALDATNQKLFDTNLVLNAEKKTKEKEKDLEETKKANEKKLENEKALNEKLIAFIKNRSQMNIKELESLLKEFERINDSVNALDAGKYGEVYDRLKNILDLFRSSQKNILESQKKIDEIEEQKKYAGNAEQAQLQKRIDSLKQELKLKKDGFDNIVNPQLLKEVENIKSIEKANVVKIKKEQESYAELMELKEFEMKVNNKISVDEATKVKNLDYYADKNNDINDLFNVREAIFERTFAKETETLQDNLALYGKIGEELLKSSNTFTDIKGILDEAADQGMVDNIFSSEDIQKYQDDINKLFGFTVDLNKLTEEQKQKIINETFDLNDKLLSNSKNFVSAETALAKSAADATLEASKMTADREIAINGNKNDEIIAQDEARLQHKEDMINAEMGLADSAANLLAVFAEDNEDVLRASIIADSAIGIGKMIISNNQANIQALASPANALIPGSAAPIIAMNNIATGLGIAANIAATAKALQKVGGGGADTGGAAAAAAPQAKFNIVGSSSSNQLAATIAQQQNQPVKAYVVGTDMTTQQALDRNIQKNATFL
jgi:hypothetical protein